MSKERSENFLEIQLITVAVCAVLAALAMLVTAVIQSNNNNHSQSRARAAYDRNQFWQVLAKNPNNLNPQSPAGRLALDLVPLVEDPVIKPNPRTPLEPKTISELGVVNGTYTGAQAQLKMTIFDTLECDCGHFTTVFLSQLADIRENRVDKLLQPVPHANSGLALTPFGLSVMLSLLAISTLGGGLGFVIATYEDSDTLRWHFNGQADGAKLAVMILTWPYFLPRAVILFFYRLIHGAYSRSRKRREARKTARIEHLRRQQVEQILSASPFAGQLKETRDNLAVLKTLLESRPDDTNLADSVRETEAMLDKLVSRVIRNITDRNRDIEDQIRSLDDAFDEVRPHR